MSERKDLLKRIVWSIINFLLYSNVWIAIAAVVMTLQTEYTFLAQLRLNRLHCFIFSSTLFVYAAHRLVALKKLESDQWQERFFYISKAQRWIFVYAVVAALSSFTLYIALPFSVQLAILVPGVLSLAYVFPVLKNKRRIRDVHFLKIFLIAMVWAWVTVIMPLITLELPITRIIYLMTFERMCFIFAITLPFDIRDLLLDQQQDVKTLPGVIGLLAAQRLAGGLMFLALLSSIVLWYGTATYNLGQLLGLLLSYGIAFGLVYQAHSERPDYYFTGLLDGTMLLQFSLFYFLGLIG